MDLFNPNPRISVNKRPLAPTIVTKLPLATSSDSRSSTLRSPNAFHRLRT